MLNALDVGGNKMVFFYLDFNSTVGRPQNGNVLAIIIFYCPNYSQSFVRGKFQSQIVRGGIQSTNQLPKSNDGRVWLVKSGPKGYCVKESLLTLQQHIISQLKLVNQFLLKLGIGFWNLVNCLYLDWFLIYGRIMINQPQNWLQIGQLIFLLKLGGCWWSFMEALICLKME